MLICLHAVEDAGAYCESSSKELGPIPSRMRAKRKPLLSKKASLTSKEISRPPPPPQGPPPPPSQWQWMPSSNWVHQTAVGGQHGSDGGQTSGGKHQGSWPSNSVDNDIHEPCPDSVERATRRLKRALYEESSREQKIVGNKPHSVSVSADGELDGGSPRKNAWDRSVRFYVPKFLDISIIDWEKQRPEAVDRLRDVLDKDFEYLNYHLSMIRFRNAIKRYLKTERSRLKAHYLLGDETCPVHVNLDQWERLKEYWSTEKHLKRSATMVEARRKVKNYSSVGRKGKAGHESSLVSLAIQCVAGLSFRALCLLLYVLNGVRLS